MNRSITVAIALAVLCLSAAAQPNQLSVSVSPNPAPLGATITVTAYDAYGQGLFTPFGCLISGIYDAPNGNSVALFPCTFLPGSIPPCGSTQPPRMQQWNQTTMAGPATPGTYWIEIQHSLGMFAPINSEWFCVKIVDPLSPGPSLSALNAPTVGTTFNMGISWPSEPGAGYFLALSGSSNTGIAIPGGIQACLDMDIWFQLSLQGFPLFQNFIGGLDGTGSATASIVLPALPALQCVPFHGQAVVLGAAGTEVTNDLLFTIN